MYIASYMLKSEKQVSKESNALEYREQLRRLGSVFLNHQEVSAPEADYRILSLPLKQLSRKVVFINTGFRKDRVSIFKKAPVLQALDDDEDMYLAEFAANYSTVSGNEEESSDVLPSDEPWTVSHLPLGESH